MIYTPERFAETRNELVHELVQKYSFATLLSMRSEFPTISHLPFLFDPQIGPHGRLTAHMAQANPHWRDFNNGGRAAVIFQGPHGYISPRWYEPKSDNVPTWNYAVVHMHGIASLIEDEKAAYAVMQRLVKVYDAEWSLDLNDKDKKALLAGIKAFQIDVESTDVKFKFSQNRPTEARRVIDGLKSSSEQGDRELGTWMTKVLGG